MIFLTNIFNSEKVIPVLVLLWPLMLLSVVGCAGYRFKVVDNPFAQYDVKSIAVPMFQNTSSLANVAGPFTREIMNSLLRYPGLKVYSGEHKNTDAVLLGIVSSAPNVRAVTGSGGGTNVDIGGRKRFQVLTTSMVSLTLTLVLIKDPTQQDIAYFLSTLSKLSFKPPRTIFSHSVGVSGSFGRAVDAGFGSDTGAVVNFTKNKGQESYIVLELAKRAAENFREAVLYAF
ncbi:MAG: hypothetical protein HQK50_02760 [Oligoflexia bacterium]|nr:hypothetical protein [Oligoflexia bacterium]MBF0364462.1 hypothetical protein [Oligoflexia bacterium]